MFVRVKTVVQDGRSYEDLQIVRAVRDGTRVRQELVASLGRRDRLVASGQLDQLLQALARFSTRLRVVEAASDERFVARAARSWGAALVFGRLWQRQGLPEILGRLAPPASSRHPPTPPLSWCSDGSLSDRLTA